LRFLALFLTLWLCVQPAFAAYQPFVIQFGGNASQGVLAKTGTESTVQFIEASDFSVASGQTWSPVSGTRINARGAVNVAGTLSVQKIAAQNPAPANIRDGRGLGAGRGSGSYAAGAAGAGNGGAGGQGGSFHSTVGTISGGLTYTPDLYFGGSTGGSGGWDNANANGVGGQAGDGGGSIKIYAAGPITIPSGGVVNLDGGNGAAGSGGSYGTSGGGGGSGGTGLLASLKSITVTATNGISAKGGIGGNGNGAGGGSFAGGVGAGGGGGGYLILVAPTISLPGGVDVSGGAAGTPASAGGGGSAAAGSTGIVRSIQVTPSLPLLGLLDDSRFIKLVLAYGKTEMGEKDLEALVAFYNHVYGKTVCL
jgi:hypothetical protein